MRKRKFGDLAGKGYYIALILCAVAIGIFGYVFQRTGSEQEPASVQVQNPTEENIPVVATQPTTPGEKPTGPAATEPTVPVSTIQKALRTAAPVAGEAIVPYAMDHLTYNQTTRDWRVHNGIDLAAQAGTKVLAAADGTVYTVYEDETMGMTVVIRHEGGYTTKYSSLAREVSVAPGDSVKMGDPIGFVGSTALMESALGDHVHFSVTCDGVSMDPREFLQLS